MNNIPPIPQLGIYVSKIDPTLRITVTDVDIVDGEDDSPDDELFYLVHWIEGEDESDMTAMGFELDPVEWQAFVESEQLVFERDPDTPTSASDTKRTITYQNNRPPYALFHSLPKLAPIRMNPPGGNIS